MKNTPRIDVTGCTSLHLITPVRVFLFFSFQDFPFVLRGFVFECSFCFYIDYIETNTFNAKTTVKTTKIEGNCQKYTPGSWTSHGQFNLMQSKKFRMQMANFTSIKSKMSQTHRITILHSLETLA